MAGDRSSLHQPGGSPYRCGPCRKGKCDRCIPIRCTCDHEGGISAEAVAAETERRLETATAQRGDRTQRVLRELAEAPAVDAKGKATSKLAERCGERNLNAFQVALGKLDRRGLVARVIVGKRTTKIEITDAGRAALASEEHPQKGEGIEGSPAEGDAGGRTSPHEGRGPDLVSPAGDGADSHDVGRVEPESSPATEEDPGPLVPAPASPTLAGVIRVERRGGVVSLTVDGQPFPWYTADVPPTVDVDRHGAPGVTLTIVAETVEVVDTLEAAS